MDKSFIYKHIISSVYKMLCWREEKKCWTTIYDELLTEISLGDFLSDEEKATLLFKIVPLKYIDFGTFRQKVFEVINYAESLPRISK